MSKQHALIAFIATIFSSISLANDFYPFTIPWDHVDPFPFDLSVPAQSRGQVQVDGEQFVYEDGQRARFWGVGIGSSSYFPPKNKKDAKALVNKLSKYGFNFVRFTGLEIKKFNVYQHWYKTGVINAELMDGLDYFIFELKQAGIAYSLTLNESSNKGNLIEGLNKNLHKSKWKKYKFVQLFDPRMRDIVKAWHIDFLSHTNKYTGLSYAEDPDHIYMTVVGEDSIFKGYYEKDSEELSKANTRTLEKMFNAYLLKKYQTDEALKASWGGVLSSGLSLSESLSSGTVEFSLADQIDGISKNKAKDIAQFLYEIDLNYVKEIKSAIRSAGFKGPLAMTNGWYGWGNMRINAEEGDFIDMHGYFEHPIRSNYRGEYTELITNKSHLSKPDAKKSIERRRAFGRNFYKFYGSAIEGKPLFLSEWNHGGWSEYTYEGPVILTAYAALQGFPGMVIHTLTSHGKDFKKEFGERSLAASNNPVFMSLSPSLSQAYRLGYISESKTTNIGTVAVDENDFWKQVLQQKIKVPATLPDMDFGTNFVAKARIRFIGEKQRNGVITTAKGRYLSDTKEIDWQYSPSKEARLEVKAEKFKALIGPAKTKEVDLEGIKVQLDEHAAITVIALDDRPIADSESIFITSVSSYKNSSQQRDLLSRHGAYRDVIRITDVGQAPVMLKRVSGRVSLQVDNGNDIKIDAIMLDGTLKPLTYTLSSDKTGSNILEFDLGKEDSPWIWVQLTRSF